MNEYLESVKKRDPAAKSILSIILTYPGVKAVLMHKVSNFFHIAGFHLIGRIISQTTRFFTGIEIHPGAKIGKNLFWGGDFNFIMNGIKEKKFHVDSFKFISGYSGWEKNQLENEIKLKSWLIIKNDYDLIKIKNNLWSKIIKDIGGETAYFFMSPDYPGLN